MSVYKNYFLVLLLQISFVNGCAVRKDVTDVAGYQGGFKKGQIYKVRRPVAFDESGILIPSSDSTIDAIRNKKNSSEVTTHTYRGIIEKGRRLQIVKLEYFSMKGVDTRVYVYAQILDGRFMGEIVRLSSLTTYYGQKRTPDNSASLRAINPKYLERCYAPVSL